MFRLTVIFMDERGARFADHMLRQMQEMPLAITVEKVIVVEQAPAAPAAPVSVPGTPTVGQVAQYTSAIVLAPKGN